MKASCQAVSSLITCKSPFPVLHISDTHLTAVGTDENAKKHQLNRLRTLTFGGRQEEALRDSIAWAKEPCDCLVHTGDLIDWQSEANFALVKFSPTAMEYVVVGNFMFQGREILFS